VKQNPLRYVDPDGAEIKIKQPRGSKVVTFEVSAVLVNASSHKFSKEELEAYRTNLKKTIEKSYKGSDKGITWQTEITITIIDDMSKAGKKDHVFRIVDATKNSSAGAAYVGGMVMDIAASTLTAPRPDQVDMTNPRNKSYPRFYQSPETVGAHELGHTMGLEHVGEMNLMYKTVRENDDSSVTTDQLRKIQRNIESGKVNIPDEEFANKKEMMN
jgi:hypothetical protein